jgi:P-type Ca2+ transporter type 2C
LSGILYVLWRGSWLEGLLGGIALSMSMLPEEFPLVLTVFIVMSAWRLSRARVLTRRAAVIETLGAATVLCTDKTGTLMQNRMALAELWTFAGSFSTRETSAGGLPEGFGKLAEFAILAGVKDPFDPVEMALHDFGRQHLAGSGRLHPDWILCHSDGLSPDLLVASQLLQPDHDCDHVVAAKGAPEAIAELCHLHPQALEEVRTKLTRWLSAACASLAWPSPPVPVRPGPARSATLPSLSRSCRPFRSLTSGRA